MTDTRTIVELDRSEWRQALSLMERGITMLDDNLHVQDARWRLHDHIEEQVDGQYDGEPETLDDLITHLEDELDMDRSVAVEEIGRTMALLRD